MKSPDCVAIMAILTEMARRLNENISKVELKPIPGTLAANGSVKPVSVGKVVKAYGESS